MTVRRPEPAAIDYKGRRFLITDRPTDANMTRYIQVRRRHTACYVAIVEFCRYLSDYFTVRAAVVHDYKSWYIVSNVSVWCVNKPKSGYVFECGSLCNWL